VRMTYLDHGDTFDLQTMRVTPGDDRVEGSVPMPQGNDLENGPIRTIVKNDILGNTTVVDVLGMLVQRRRVEAIGLAFDGVAALREPTKGFEFRFYPGADSAGWF